MIKVVLRKTRKPYPGFVVRNRRGRPLAVCKHLEDARALLRDGKGDSVTNWDGSVLYARMVLKDPNLEPYVPELRASGVLPTEDEIEEGTGT